MLIRAFCVAIALTVYGIETAKSLVVHSIVIFIVAIALTVYGIETCFPNEKIFK